MSLEENFEAYFKEKYVNEEREQNTETDNPNFRVGFLEFLQKDQHKPRDIISITLTSFSRSVL